MNQSLSTSEPQDFRYTPQNSVLGLLARLCISTVSSATLKSLDAEAVKPIELNHAIAALLDLHASLKGSGLEEIFEYHLHNFDPILSRQTLLHVVQPVQYSGEVVRTIDGKLYHREDVVMAVLDKYVTFLELDTLYALKGRLVVNPNPEARQATLRGALERLKADLSWLRSVDGLGGVATRYSNPMQAYATSVEAKFDKNSPGQTFANFL